MTTANEPPLVTWISVAAALVGMASGLVALGNTLADIALLDILQASAWVMVLCGAGGALFLFGLAYEESARPFHACLLVLLALLAGAGTYLLVEARSMLMLQVEGIAVSAMLLLMGAVTAGRRLRRAQAC